MYYEHLMYVVVTWVSEERVLPRGGKGLRGESRDTRCYGYWISLVPLVSTNIRMGAASPLVDAVRERPPRTAAAKIILLVGEYPPFGGGNGGPVVIKYVGAIH